MTPSGAVRRCVAALLVLAGITGPSADPGDRGFLENRGQIDAAVRYYAIGDRRAVFFTADGLVLELRGTAEPVATRPRPGPTRVRERRVPEAGSRFALRLGFIEGNADTRVEGLGELPGVAHFLLGDDRAGWRSGVPAFERVVYRDAWPGVDVVYRADGDALTYELVVGAGVDPAGFRLAWQGATSVLGSGPTRRIETPLGTIEDRRDPGGRGGTILLPAAREAVSADGPAPETGSPADARAFDTPMELGWSTFLGGSRDDTVYAVAVDVDGRVVVTGAVRSADFPTTLGALDTSYAASFDAFVAKLEADGSTAVWSTFLGDSDDDRGWAVRIDASGRPVVAGVTASTGFPVSSGAFDVSHNGLYDAFVAKLEADGSGLVWSTFYGGAQNEWDVSGLDLDASERVVVAGSTRSADLPTSAGAHDAVLDGAQDAFVAELESDGSALVFGTYLGGGDQEAGEDVTVDASGRPVVAGWTLSGDFPVTAGALQTAPAGSEDVFVARLAADGTAVVLGTYLGGGARDQAFAVDLDADDRILIAGHTVSSDFPTTPGALERVYAGSGDAFVARLDADGSALSWSTYLGGGGEERALDLAADAGGQPAVTGWTCSEDFPTAGEPWDDTFNGPCDGFVAKLDVTGTALLYATFVGGWRDDAAYALALAPGDVPVVAGETFSTNFPTTAGAFDVSHNSPDSWYDGFVLSLLLPATWCTHVTGTPTPVLTLEPGITGSCPPAEGSGAAVDIIEGDLAQVSASDLGVVEPIACGATRATFENATSPSPGQVLFQLARFAGGTYADGGGPGLVGGRVPAGGDCP